MDTEWTLTGRGVDTVDTEWTLCGHRVDMEWMLCGHGVDMDWTWSGLMLLVQGPYFENCELQQLLANVFCKEPDGILGSVGPVGCVTATQFS